MAEELQGLRTRLGGDRFDRGRYAMAARLFEQMSTGESLPEFLTLPAYQHLD